MRLSKDHETSIIDHARRSAPLECVGILGGRGDCVTHVLEAENLEGVCGKFSLSYAERKRLLEALVQGRLDLVAVYHSHPNSNAYPSLEDLMGAFGFYEQCAHVIVSLAGGNPVVRAFRVHDRTVSEEAISNDV